MSIQRAPRVDRDTAERLVAGEGVGPVASVLRAAAVPAHQDELAGEAVAVAAFRAAATADPARQPVFRKAVAKALIVKGAIVLAIGGSTGVVLAASEGVLPVPWSNRPADLPATTTTITVPTAPSTSGDRTAESGRPPAAPAPAMVDLCEAYEADEDKDLDNPAFRELVEAAGGKDGVAGYCELVEASPSAEPDQPADTERAPGSPPAHVPTVGSGASNIPDLPEPPVDPGRPESVTPSKSKTRKEPTNIPTAEELVTKTPGSPAPGAATAVPPSGAEPPSTGG